MTYSAMCNFKASRILDEKNITQDLLTNPMPTRFLQIGTGSCSSVHQSLSTINVCSGRGCLKSLRGRWAAGNRPNIPGSSAKSFSSRDCQSGRCCPSRPWIDREPPARRLQPVRSYGSCYRRVHDLMSACCHDGRAYNCRPRCTSQ